MKVGLRGTKERLDGVKGLFIGGAPANRVHRAEPVYGAQTTVR
jgi:hypothetical protein